MNVENKLAEAYQIQDCDHNFTGKEEKLSNIIDLFTKKKILNQ